MNDKIVNSRTGLGAGIGALAGFVFGGPLGTLIGAVVGGGIAHATNGRKKGEMTPQRKIIFERTLDKVKDPEELRRMAAAFHGEGLVAEANMLTQRAALRELPENIKHARREVFRNAMTSEKPDEIAHLADVYAQYGALNSAKALHDHAEAVRVVLAAGKSLKPTDPKIIEGFADKLARAVIGFGPGSVQASSAARNLIRAQGRQVTDQNVIDIIATAVEATQLKTPEKAEGDPPAGEGAEGAPEAKADEPPPVVKATPDVEDATPVEPRVRVAGDEEPEVSGEETKAPPPKAAAVGAPA